MKRRGIDWGLFSHNPAPRMGPLKRLVSLAKKALIDLHHPCPRSCPERAIVTYQPPHWQQHRTNGTALKIAPKVIITRPKVS